MNFDIVKRLSVTATLQDRIISIIGLILLATCFFALSHQTEPGVYQFKLKWFLNILLILWLVTSVINKALVVYGLKMSFLGGSAVVCFMLLFAFTIILGESIVPCERPVFYEVLAFTSLAGTVFIDAALTFD